MTCEENIAERVFRLMEAKTTLETEGIATDTIAQQISERVKQLLTSHPDEVAKIICHYQSQNSPNNLSSTSAQDRSHVVIPENIKHALTEKRSLLVELLFEAYRNHDFVDHKRLMNEIYNENLNDGEPLPIKIRSLILQTNRAIHKWGIIKVVSRKGYRLVINGME